MTIEEALSLGYVIGRYPKERVSLYDIRHHKEGNEILEVNGRKYTKEVRPIQNALLFFAKTEEENFWHKSPSFTAQTIEELLSKIEEGKCTSS